MSYMQLVAVNVAGPKVASVIQPVQSGGIDEPVLELGSHPMGVSVFVALVMAWHPVTEKPFSVSAPALSAHVPPIKG
jgi:hypothetical protein